jgi:hypothetical protein
MSFPERQDMEDQALLEQALALLPAIPGTIEVISENGGAFPLTLAAVEGFVIYAYGHRELVGDNLVIETRPRSENGDGHDIRFRILRSYFQASDELLLHLKVIEVEEKSGERSSPRAPLAAQAALRVLYGREQRAGLELDVRLVDVSPVGMAFIADRAFATGDMVEIFADVNGTSLRVECRAVESIPAIYGRHRTGCEITEILPSDRYVLTELAAQVKSQDSAAERRPEVVEQLERARHQRTLNTRPPERRYPGL